VLEADVLSALAFIPRGVLTAAKTGASKLWIRPLALQSRRNVGARRLARASGSAVDDS
jgi:hypothetical protein